MAEIESLFGTSSLTPPKPRIARPAEPTADALGAALLTGMLSDINSLKQYWQDQLGLNTVANRAMQDHWNVITALVDQVNNLSAIVVELDQRLAEKDGKRSAERGPETTLAEPEPPAAA